MPKTPIKKAAKRQNATKEDLEVQIRATQANEHIKEICKEIFPHLEGLDTIYDAQTAVNALSGFIMAHVENKLCTIKMNEITIDLSKEEDSKIKDTVLKLAELLKDEPAKSLSSVLDRMGQVFSRLGAEKFLKQPMTDITIDDIIAK